MMRRILLIVPVVAMMLAVSSTASAQTQTTQYQTYNNYQTTQQPRTTYRRTRTRKGFFQRLMELERRKNAWLRETFLERF